MPRQIEETALKKTIQKDSEENLDRIFLKEKFRNVSDNDFNSFISNIRDGLRTKAPSQEDSFILSQSESFFAIELKDIYTNSFFVKQKKKIFEKNATYFERSTSSGIFQYPVYYKYKSTLLKCVK